MISLWTGDLLCVCIDWMACLYLESRTIRIYCIADSKQTSSDVNVDGIQTPEGGQLAVRETMVGAVQVKATEVQL